MRFEIEFKLINIKDISKIQQIEEIDDSLFGIKKRVECQRDITDEYCKNIINCIMTSLASGCTSKYIGCTNRIGHYEFEISKGDIKYTVIFQQDTYECNMQLTVSIGYKTNKSELSDGYDDFLECLKLNIKNSMIGDWNKCIWISDSQSLNLAKEVYFEIYMAENELRAFISKVMIENFGAEWYDKPEFSKLNASIELNTGNVKRCVPNFANIDVNLFTVTLEVLMSTVESDIYTDSIPDNPEIQKSIKSKIFATTQLDKMQSALDYLKNRYIKKYNIWEKCFRPFISGPGKWQDALHIFIDNRNHVAHNKLLDFSAKEKMIHDTVKFRELIRDAVHKFDGENRSTEVEETLQAIEEQREYEREAQLEIVESEAGIKIRDKKMILELFQDTVSDIYTDVCSRLYFDEWLDVNEISSLQNKADEQLLFTINHGNNAILKIYGFVDIDDSEGAASTMRISVVAGDEDIDFENIEYVNGEAEYNSEQTSYMPVVADSYDDGNKETVKEVIDDFLRKRMESYETNSYSKEKRAEEDWLADAADVLEER